MSTTPKQLASALNTAIESLRLELAELIEQYTIEKELAKFYYVSADKSSAIGCASFTILNHHRTAVRKLKTVIARKANALRVFKKMSRMV